MLDNSIELPSQPEPPHNGGDRLTYADLLTRYAVASFDKQLHLQEVFGKQRGWSFDLNASTLTLSDMQPFHIQLLGTESEQSKTWLWAWANTESGIPPVALEAAEQLRTFGTNYNIRQFTASELLITENDNGFYFSLIASGLLGADSFYRASYDGGALYMLLQDQAYPRTSENILMRTTRIIPAAMKKLNLNDPRGACFYYLTWYGFDVKATDSMLVAADKTGSVLRVRFDEHNQFADVSADII